MSIKIQKNSKNETLEAAKWLKKIIELVAKETVNRMTRECPRIYKAKVIGAPSGSVCSVQLVADNSVLQLPYSSRVSGAHVGDMVWVMTIYNSFSSAIVWETIDFK